MTPQRLQFLGCVAEDATAYAHSLSVGDTFIGTMPVARQRYPDDLQAQHLFAQFACIALPDVMHVDANNRLTLVGRYR